MKEKLSYITTDGKEFDDKPVAQAHEAATMAEKEIDDFINEFYATAADRYKKSLRSVLFQWIAWHFNKLAQAKTQSKVAPIHPSDSA